MKRMFSACITLVCLAGGLVPARAQSLAEVAKKEADRRKAGGTASKTAPKKVYTNEDLKPAPPPSPGSITTPAAPEAKDASKHAAAQKEAAKKPEEEKGEEYWRARMSQARESLRRNEMFREALQTRINSLTNDFSARDDPYQRAQLADDRQKAMAEMARVTQEIETLNKQIADIEEEARQAGVPPGWLR